MPVPDAFDNIPASVQYAINIGVGIATAVGAGWLYIKRLNTPKPKDEKATDFVVQAAQFMDMGPIREQNRIMADILVEIRASRDHLHEIVEHMVAFKQERTINQEVEKRLHDVLTERAHQAVAAHHRLKFTDT